VDRERFSIKARVSATYTATSAVVFGTPLVMLGEIRCATITPVYLNLSIFKSTPFFASTFMAKSGDEYPVPMRIKSQGPYFAETSVGESSFVLTYSAPICDQQTTSV
jgi:hypothetical protein